MGRKTTVLIWALLALAMVHGSATRAQIAFTFTPPTQSGAPGDTLSFLGTLTNGPLVSSVTAFSFVIADLELDESPFLEFLTANNGTPPALSTGVNFFDVFIPLNATPGFYQGEASITYTNSAGTFTTPVQNFAVTVSDGAAATPVPPGLVVAGIGGLMGLVQFRRGRKRQNPPDA